MAKRAGLGHREAGLLDVRPGECAITCPACPSLPDDQAWDEGASIHATSHDQAPGHLNRLITAQDANFRLTLRKQKVESDLPLGDGWAYRVPTQPFARFTAEFGDVRQEVSPVPVPDRTRTGTQTGTNLTDHHPSPPLTHSKAPVHPPCCTQSLMQTSKGDAS